MKQYLYHPQKGNNARKKNYGQVLAEKTPPYLITDSPSSRLDDFLLRFPIATVNEYGERVISGKRIC
jgi:hypothetical protein